MNVIKFNTKDKLPARENAVARIKLFGGEYIATYNGIYDVKKKIWVKGPWEFKYLISADSWD